VGPTPNPSLLLRSIRFKRYDFPVRYMPATATIAILPTVDDRIDWASSPNIYSEWHNVVLSLLSIMISGMAFSLYFCIFII
jgi:hypothetical protein